METNLIEYTLLCLAGCLLRLVYSASTIMMTNVEPYANKRPVSYTSTTARSSLECVYQCNLMTSCDTTFYHETSGVCILMTTGAAMPQMIASTGFNTYKIYCADGGFFEVGSLCIKFVLDKKNWNEAQAFCQQLNGNSHLLNFQTASKKNTFDSFIGGSSNTVIWIGASDSVTENSYKWTDGSDVNLDLFSYAINNIDVSVNSNNADCLVYRYSLPNDAIDDDCIKEIHEFVCEVN